MKDGVTLATDEIKYKTYQTVTDRQSSTYQNTLVVDDVTEHITGNYICQVTNSFGSSSRVLTVSKGKAENLEATTLVFVAARPCSTKLFYNLISP